MGTNPAILDYARRWCGQKPLTTYNLSDEVETKTITLGILKEIIQYMERPWGTYSFRQSINRQGDLSGARKYDDPFGTLKRIFDDVFVRMAPHFNSDTQNNPAGLDKLNPEAKIGRFSKAGRKIEATLETTELEGNSMRVQVFICYSHKDKRWLEDLQTHLKPYVRNGSLTAWSDKQIVPGSKWFPDIKAALASTKVAVLLVTPNFIASDFIHEHELTPLLKEAEKGNVRIIWVSVRTCAYKETPLKEYQAANDPDKPLANMKVVERDKAWVTICEKIEKAVSSS